MILNKGLGYRYIFAMEPQDVRDICDMPDLTDAQCDVILADFFEVLSFPPDLYDCLAEIIEDKEMNGWNSTAAVR